MTWRIDLKRSVLQSAREFIPEIAHWSMTADDDAIYSSSTEPSVEYRLLIYPRYEVVKISEPNTNRWHIASWTGQFVSHARTRGRRIDQRSRTMKTWPVRFRYGQYWSFDLLTVNYPYVVRVRRRYHGVWVIERKSVESARQDLFTCMAARFKRACKR